MSLKPLILSLAIIAAPGVQAASACEFHGGGFGPYGAQWQNHYGAQEQSTYEDAQLGSDLQAGGEAKAQPAPQMFVRRPVERPTFSNAATRAAGTAKDRIEKQKPEATKKAEFEPRSTNINLLNPDG